MSKKDIEEMFQSQGGASSIGLNPKGSEIVVANLNATTLPMCVGTPIEEIDSDDITVVFFALDMSPSMEPVEQALIDAFNNIMIPGLKGGCGKTTQNMIVGGLAFTESIYPLWGGGFKKLSQLPKMTRKDYNTSRGSATALHQAMLDSLTAVSVYSAKVLNETGIPPKVIVVVLSDGANNCMPQDPGVVRKVAEQLSKEMFVLAFAGFQTFEHVDFHEIAADTGFGAIFESQDGGSQDELGRRFRHLVGVMSSSIIQQSRTQVSAAASNSFWQV